jgi:hypothetical protein
MSAQSAKSGRLVETWNRRSPSRAPARPTRRRADVIPACPGTHALLAPHTMPAIKNLRHTPRKPRQHNDILFIEARDALWLPGASRVRPSIVRRRSQSPTSTHSQGAGDALRGLATRRGHSPRTGVISKQEQALALLITQSRTLIGHGWRPIRHDHMQDKPQTCRIRTGALTALPGCGAQTFNAMCREGMVGRRKAPREWRSLPVNSRHRLTRIGARSGHADTLSLPSAGIGPHRLSHHESRLALRPLRGAWGLFLFWSERHLGFRQTFAAYVSLGLARR